MQGKHYQGNCVMAEEKLCPTQSEIAILLPSSQESGLLCVYYLFCPFTAYC